VTVVVDGDTRARAWVAHLRQGGTTRWRAFEPVAGEYDDPAPLPGAAQLELVRRLNERTDEESRRGTAHRALLERVLATSGVGRGPIEQPLVGGPERRFGTPPVDPARLAPRTLLRVAVGVLAESVAAADTPPPAPATAGLVPRLRGLVQGYALAGDPMLVHDTARALRAAGRPPGSTPRTVLLLGDDLQRVLGDVWAWRVSHGASVPWDRWLARRAREDRLPRPADLPLLADHWGRRLGVRRVHVALGRNAVTEAARVLGVRNLPAYDEVPRLSRAALDLVRETNLVLRLMVPNDRHRALLRTVLVPLLADETGRPPMVPDGLAAWVARREGEQRAALARGGYALHGDPALPHPAGDARDDDVLAVALRALLHTRTEVA